MNRIVALLVLTLPILASAQPVIQGVSSVVRSGPGNQTDPHVSGDTVVYSDSTNGGEIHWHDLLTGGDWAIPNNGAQDATADVSGNSIVYARMWSGGSGICSYDTAQLGAPFEVAPQQGSNRRYAAIGGNTVAWQDYGFSSALAPEIVLFDRSTPNAQAVRLTDDLKWNGPPAVSPDGTAVTWTRCDPFPVSCDVWSATQDATGVWSKRALTATGQEDFRVDTNGAVSVYVSFRSGEADVYWQPVGGGAEQHLVFPGEERNPRIAGNLLAFEHLEAMSWDLYIYDLASNTLYALPTTPTVDESLNDISIGAGDVVRVVWDQLNAEGNSDVLAFSFVAPRSGNGGGGGCEEGSQLTPEQICDGAGPDYQALQLASISMSRGTGKPQTQAQSFTSEGGEGVLCVYNAQASSGWVKLNGQQAAGPSDFNRHATRLARPVMLNEGQNSLGAHIASAPGSAFTATVFKRPQGGSCAATSSVSPGTRLRLAHVPTSQLKTLVGRQATLLSDAKAAPFALVGGFSGCSTTGGGAPVAAALALVALALLRRRAEVPVRNRGR